jgi:hypothetical protein
MLWFLVGRDEVLKDTAGERLAAIQTQRNLAFLTDFPRDG